MVFAVLATATWLVALFTYVGGNVFAPAFAFADSAFLAACLRWVWLQGERFEEIAITPGQVEVRQSRQAEPMLRAHPYWVRLRVSRMGGEPHIHMASSGREVEVGSFLCEAERLDLLKSLKNFLAAAAGALPGTDNS